MDENTWGYQKNAKLAMLALETLVEKAAWDAAEQLPGSPGLLPLAIRLEKRLRKRLEKREIELLGKKSVPRAYTPGFEPQIHCIKQEAPHVAGGFICRTNTRGTRCTVLAGRARSLLRGEGGGKRGKKVLTFQTGGLRRRRRQVLSLRQLLGLGQLRRAAAAAVGLGWRWRVGLWPGLTSLRRAPAVVAWPR